MADRTPRYLEESPLLMKKLIDLGRALDESSLDHRLRDLVNVRASQLNGCTFCLDMHVKEAKIHGERELRLYHVAAWRESTLFSAQERAALEWTEAVTDLAGHGISDDVFQRTRAVLSDRELSDLTIAIGIINVFNRLNVAMPRPPGALDQMFGLTKAGLS